MQVKKHHLSDGDVVSLGVHELVYHDLRGEDAGLTDQIEGEDLREGTEEGQIEDEDIDEAPHEGLDESPEAEDVQDEKTA